jgi:ERCC4-related helicase/dsRNA-specific ribonuclease
MELIHLKYEKTTTNDLETVTSKGKVYFDRKSLNIDFYNSEGEYQFTKNAMDIKLLEKEPSKISFEEKHLGDQYSITYDPDESVELYTWKLIKDHIESFNQRRKENMHKLKHIISEPKEYQMELFNFAKERNSIIFLETGLGKTYIAIMLIKDMYGEDLRCNILNPIEYKKKSNKKVIFLFKTITLLLQQAKVLKNNTKLKIYKIYGGDNTPTYAKFRASMGKYDIICATPESIYRYLTFGYLKLEDIGMVILDECHHAKEKDYYNRILKHYIHFDSSIKIVGLTASPSFDMDKTEEKILENVQTLCNNMNCYLICPSAMLKDYMTNEKEVEIVTLPDENVEKIASDLKLFIFRDLIYEILSKYKRIQDLSKFTGMCEQYETLFYLNLLFTLFADEEKLSEKENGVWEKSDIDLLRNLNYFETPENIELLLTRLDDKINFSRELKEISKKLEDDVIVSKIQKYLKNINYMIKYFDIETIAIQTNEVIENLFATLKDLGYDYPYDINWLKDSFLPKLNSFKYKSPYLTCLEEFLNSDKILQYDNKTVIFTNQRLIAKLYNDKFLQVLRSKSYICSYVVGCQSKTNINFTEDELKANIGEFRDNPHCAILFATNVIEEGFDLPQCNNVVNLSEIKTIKEYIQKSGRARANNSSIILFSPKEQIEVYKANIEQIKLGVKVMKQIVTEKALEPKYIPEKYIEGIHYYQTPVGARLYYTYASQLVNEFNSKLFFDGYCHLRSEPKTDEREIDGKKYFLPYLALPYVLDNFNLMKIADGSKFETHKEARNYYDKYSDYFFLKAVKMLHQHKYFDDNFNFYKNYDELLHLDSNVFKALCEPTIKLKPFEASSYYETEEQVELIAHKLDIQPGYFDFNYLDKSKNNIMAVISDSELTYINFDVFIHSFQLLKLYYFNDAYIENHDMIKEKPKIDYTYFSKINVTINDIQKITIPKSKLIFIDFFYTYILYFSTDAEAFFYYNIYNKKYEFCDLFLKDSEVNIALDYIFKYSNFNEKKKHLLEFQKAKLQYANHPVKFTVLKENLEGAWEFDFEYIESVLKSIKQDILTYSHYIKFNLIKTPEEKGKLITSPEYYATRSYDLSASEQPIESPEIGKIYRNLINYTKYMIHFNSSAVEIKGSSQYKKTDKLYHQHILEKYNTIIDVENDFSKCIPLDYNQKIMKYKINIKSLGYVCRKLHKREIKKCTYLPRELLQRVSFATLDQLYLFTLFPIILQKVQNNLIYYYQASCLRQRFNAFEQIPSVDMRLLTQALNSKSTMEFDNYERLEFLGDAVLKFLSSFEVFKKYPNGNKDLLFSKRRHIESNKSLFQVASKDEVKLSDFIFTTPMTLKKVSIPGFNNDESLMFCIGYNRSFAKNCILNRLYETYEKPLTSDINPELPQVNPEDLLNLKKKDEEVSDKTIINIDLDSNADNNIPTKYYPVSYQEILDIVKRKIDVVESKTYRHLYIKVLADAVESLVGFLFMSDFSEKYFSKDMFKLPSNFLTQIGIFSGEFDLDTIEPFWLEGLKYTGCKKSDKDKQKLFAKLLKNQYYEFNNPELMYQASTHSTFLQPENFEKGLPYVNKSYQRLAFLGEALLGFYVAQWVYNKTPNGNESILHKLKICGVNQHLISLVAINLGLRDCLLVSNRDVNHDLDAYRKYWDNIRSNNSDKPQFTVEDEKKLDENFIGVI